MRCIAFHLGEGRYALPLRDLVEILPLLPAREVPHAPDYIGGIINYRGQAVPVLDLCQLALGRPCQARISTRLIVLRLPGHAGCLLALMVERAVSDVNLDPNTFEPSPLRIAATPYLKEFAVSATGLVQLVDASHLLPEEVLNLLCQEVVSQP